MNRLLVLLLMLLVVLSPFPMGSNHEWSWSLCALFAGLLALAWSLNQARRRKPVTFVHPAITVLFLGVCLWAALQAAGWVPAAWRHPLWAQTAGVLGVELAGSISMSAEDTWLSLMRLLAYGLVFFLAYQLALERSRAHAILRWLVAAGLFYAVFGLVVYWGDLSAEFLFRDRAMPNDLRSTFVNRNHFATWQGLTLLCAMALFHLRMSRPPGRPYTLPRDRETSVEQFVIRAWLPLMTVLLMVTALVLTHSRGGFAATLAATVALLMMLDWREPGGRWKSRSVVVAALLVSSIAFYLTSEVLLQRIDRTDITGEERMVVFENVQRGISENPLVGFGYGTFADSFRLYDRVAAPVHYDRAHNTWLENLFELGVPAALALFAAIGGLALTCLRGVRRRQRDWALPALGVAATVLVGVHALVDFSLQIPAVAILYACVMGLACAQARSSRA